MFNSITVTPSEHVPGAHYVAVDGELVGAIKWVEARQAWIIEGLALKTYESKKQAAAKLLAKHFAALSTRA